LIIDYRDAIMTH